MFSINQSIINGFASKINAKESKSNKVTSLSSSSTDTQYPSAKAVYDEVQNNKFSGSYNDLTNKPTIPTRTSDLTNDSGFLTSHQSLDNYIQKSNTTGLLKNDGTIATNILTSSETDTHISNALTGFNTSILVPNYVQKSNTTGLLKNDGSVMASGTGSTNYAAGNHTHSNYELNTNKTSSITSDTGSTTKYPTVKAVEDALDDAVGMNIEDYYLDTTNDEIVLEYSNNGDMPSGFDISDLTDVDIVNVVVTYEDSTTETIKLLKYTGN